jgi:hypothetical protein
MQTDGVVDATYVSADIPKMGRVTFVVKLIVDIGPFVTSALLGKVRIGREAALYGFGRDVLGKTGDPRMVIDEAERFIEGQARFHGGDYQRTGLRTDCDAATARAATVPGHTRINSPAKPTAIMLRTAPKAVA